jgi:hypothetical protein
MGTRLSLLVGLRLVLAIKAAVRLSFNAAATDRPAPTAYPIQHIAL